MLLFGRATRCTVPKGCTFEPERRGLYTERKDDNYPSSLSQYSEPSITRVTRFLNNKFAESFRRIAQCIAKV